MQSKNQITFQNTVKMFLTETIYDIKNETEVPKVCFQFEENAYQYFNTLKEQNLIKQQDIEFLRKLETLDNETPLIHVRDYVTFFLSLKEIINYLVELNQFYFEVNYSALFIGECLLRRIWMRMGPTDFQHVETFLRKQLEFMTDDTLNDYLYPSKVDTYYGCDVIAEADLNTTHYEANRCLKFILLNEGERHNLGDIHYDILTEGTKKICYIYAVQANKQKDHSSRIERLVYQINEGILETESLEYFDYLTGKSNYYPENIADVHPNQVLALYYFIKLLKKNNITDIKVPLLQVLSYDYHILLSKTVKEKFKNDWNSIEQVTDLPNWLTKAEKARYIKEKKWHDRIVNKEDLISKNKTEKLIRLFNRAAYHCREMELRTESMLEGDYLDIKLTKSKTKKLS